MRTGCIALLATLLMSASVRAQAQTAPPEFTLRAFTLALRIPTSVGNRDGTPMTTGDVLWVAVKNETTIPYSLCTAARGLAVVGGSGGVSGASHCSPYWIVLPGETHFEAMNVPVPVDPLLTLLLTVTLEGKPLGVTGNLATWTLMWTGTVGETLATGERMKALERP